MLTSEEGKRSKRENIFVCFQNKIEVKGVVDNGTQNGSLKELSRQT